MQEWELPRETKELVGPLVVSVDGAVTTLPWTAAVLPWGQRPDKDDDSVWASPLSVDGSFWVQVGAGTPIDPLLFTPAERTWRIFIRVPNTPLEDIVLDDVGIVRFHP